MDYYPIKEIPVPVSLKHLQLKFKPYNTANKLSPALQRLYNQGKFQHVYSDPDAASYHTLLRGADQGIIAYHVPAAALQSDHQSVLSESIKHLQDLPRIKQQHKGVDRGVAVQRHYIVWCSSAKVPFVSKEFREDKEPAQNFMNDSQGLWKEASEIFRRIWLRQEKRFTEHETPPGTTRMAGSWCGCAVNIGSEDNPVQTLPHRDVGESPFGISCLTAFGNYHGGDVVLWEAKVIIQMRSGDLLFFPDALIHHSNEPVTDGVRHSVVAFTPHNMFSWFNRAYGEGPLNRDIRLRGERKLYEARAKKRKLEKVKGKETSRKKKRSQQRRQVS